MSAAARPEGRPARNQTIAFHFDGRRYEGAPGDTLAAALLANGVRLFARSFKYHRPRGVLSAGVEEPNALVEVGEGGRREPNTRATDIFLYDGLVARSQNAWPSLAVDVGAVAGAIAPFIPAGFYYKTFLGPARLWRLYEPFIRAAAGLGRPPDAADPDLYERRAAFCDVLVVGSGPAGLAAALSAATGGARVMLVEQDGALGGGLLRDPVAIDAAPADAFISRAASAVHAAGGRALTRTTAYGYWDHDLVTLVQRLVEPGQAPGEGGPAQRLWRVRAGRVILATGAIERPLVFANNDAPGVMLSRAVRTYATRFGIAVGRRAVIATNNDDGYRTALALMGAGAKIAAVFDTRSPTALGPGATAIAAALPTSFGAAIVEAKAGAGGVRAVVATIQGAAPVTVAADLLAMSGGFSPVVHLHMQAGGTLSWRDGPGDFIPKIVRQRQMSVGAAAGVEALNEALAQGHGAGGSPAPPPVASEDWGAGGAEAAFSAPGAASRKACFVDFQNDVTVADIDLAHQEGYRSIEHLKRYTTLGMGTDQGKTSNIVGIAQLAAAQNLPVAAIGVTTFRPPYTPVTLGALAGETVGAHVAPRRRLALEDEHRRRAPILRPVGYWSRPRAYPRGDETGSDAARREAHAVRTRIGLIDISTLGKFEIAGPDALDFMEMICPMRLGRIEPGQGRYVFMLREDGMVMDDGTLWRLSPGRFFLTSSTGGADRLATQLSYVRRVLAPHLRVSIAEMQEHWAAAAIAGPRARAVIAELTGVEPPAHMRMTCATIAAQEVRVLAASYSGERAFEIYAPASRVTPVWRALVEGVEARGGCLYGLDALELLRIEKGHVVVGGEIDGRRTPGDLGLDRMLRRGGGFFGAQALTRPALSAADRHALVGLTAHRGAIPEGAMLISDADGGVDGHVTAAGARVLGGGSIALGLLARGRARWGETMTARSPTRGASVRVEITAPIFYDPEGARYRD